MKIEKPVEKDSSHFPGDFRLFSKVVVYFVLLFLLPEHMRKAVIKVGWDHLFVLFFGGFWQFGKKGLVLGKL